MKVVIFCGGMGLRLREHEEQLPKPMIPIGYRPMLWHVMRYYAHFGHTDFILCLGYKSDAIKEYFLSYNEALTNDFVLEKGGRQVTLLRSDIDDWRISFVDTGLTSNVGQRLRAVRRFVGDDEVFLANYADVLTDAHLPSMIEEFHRRDAIAQMMAVQPNYTFHLVDADSRGLVTKMRDVGEADLWINGGYFVFRREIFDFIEDGDELVREPFDRVMRLGRLSAYRHKGFWVPLDTIKEKQALDDMYNNGQRPWCVWEADPAGSADEA
jgi:glucose-1-phosphate cytidylyltransferase